MLDAKQISHILVPLILISFEWQNIWRVVSLELLTIDPIKNLRFSNKHAEDKYLQLLT